MRTAISALLLSLVATACTQSGDDADCTDGKCDTPGGSVKQKCENSRVSAMDMNRPHFTPGGVRWSCRDVNGVTATGKDNDDRGQEYCEYFTMLHTSGIPELDANAFCDANTPCGDGKTCDEGTSSCVTGTSVDTSKPADILGKNTDPQAPTVTALDPTLKQTQLDWLAANPDAKVGECVFTSWHEDIDKPVANASETIAGWRLDSKNPVAGEPLFRMENQVNSNAAAQTLLHDCLTPGKSTIKDGFTRGCTMCGGKDCVAFRKSDPSVCTMAMRIAECGCSVTVAGKTTKLDVKKAADMKTLQELFIPKERRGFALGTWDGVDKLPNGCRYVRTGDTGQYSVAGVPVKDANADQNIVACDLKASHIMASTAKDPKEACRATYGEDIVVHVRTPTPDMATLTCDTSKPKCQGIPWDFGNL